LSWVLGIEVDDRAQAADVKDHAAGKDQAGPDQPKGGCRLHDGRPLDPEPLVQCQGQDDQENAKHRIDDQVPDVHNRLVVYTESDLLDGLDVLGAIGASTVTNNAMPTTYVAASISAAMPPIFCRFLIVYLLSFAVGWHNL
jgi:hypothetical protein